MTYPRTDADYDTIALHEAARDIANGVCPRCEDWLDPRAHGESYTLDACDVCGDCGKHATCCPWNPRSHDAECGGPRDRTCVCHY